MLVMFWPSRRRIVKVMEMVTYVVVAVDVVVIRTVVKRVMVVVLVKVVDVVVVVVKVIVVHLPERIRLSGANHLGSGLWRLLRAGIRGWRRSSRRSLGSRLRLSATGAGRFG